MKKRKMARKYNVWSQEDIKKLMTMVTKGKSNEDIAKALGRKRTDIASKKCRLGLSGKPTARTKVDRSIVTNHSRRWTKDEHNSLLRMLENGASLDVCAQSLGRTVSSIENRVSMIRRTAERTKNSTAVTERSFLWGLIKTKSTS